MNFNCYTPAETTELVSRAGVAKANIRIDKILMSGIIAGMLLSFACASVLSTNTVLWYQENAPGLIRTISALIFPYGLCAIILTGSDLCTGSFLFTTVAVLYRRLSIPRMLMRWILTFLGNLSGSLFIVAIIVGYGGVFDVPTYAAEVRTFVTAKQVTPKWQQVFLKGIGANWLVCLACFLGLSGREYVSMMVGIWWPTFAFISLDFDHVVANMFLVPMGIWCNTPDLTVGLYIRKGIIPARLGNIIGGGFFVGTYMYY
ncbi:Formate/nitrite transporter [Bimuria novae-zelandiae CBS 107.79]|uniref:Formate/nitrite transporter n=1 Tax=Bimuria novae-zelandiae CBS 107.79 TaxID=1447943 RepID=A0A6A5ULX0_9PLEO|nr:Formate/nitrite transporter [Bimuria novae-zelandiae CBS 107.79]